MNIEEKCYNKLFSKTMGAKQELDGWRGKLTYGILNDSEILGVTQRLQQEVDLWSHLLTEFEKSY